MTTPRVVVALAAAVLPAVAIYLVRSSSDRRFWAAEVAAGRFTSSEAAALLARGLKVHADDRNRLAVINVTAAALSLAVAGRVKP